LLFYDASMSIDSSQRTTGYILMALGVFVAITGVISYRRGGRMKVLSFVGLVIVSLGFGAKLAFGPERKPVEVKQVTTPFKAPLPRTVPK
jgi:hypothetical protein